MPSKSAAQHRLMEAAAHTAGGYGGVSQAVGKEFVAADRHDVNPEWPDKGSTFDAIAPAEPWVRDEAMTETDLAEAIRDGAPSPQWVGNSALFDVRITGTGVAYRDKNDEWAIRDADLWTDDEFVRRCNGLAVVDGHPDRPGLDTQEFRKRAIGNVVLPYRKGDEVWGVARIFDADAAHAMQTSKRSTSPGVFPAKGNDPQTMNDGSTVLDETLPLYLDHLAICEAGVWDKGGAPAGVRLDSTDSRRDRHTVTLDELRAKHDSEKSEMDSRHDKELKDAAGRNDEEETTSEKEVDKHEDKHEQKGDSVKDAAFEGKETEKEEKEEKREEREDKSKKDESGAATAEPNPDKGMDVVKGDSSKKDETKKEEREDAQRHDKKDEEERQDSVRKIGELERIVRDQGRTIARLQTPLPYDEQDRLASAYHRADTLAQMLQERTPQTLQGESSLSYRKRALRAFRPFTEDFKEYALHDATANDPQAFKFVEDAIYAQAEKYALKPPEPGSKLGSLRAVHDDVTMPGKRITKWVGDWRLAWLPFQPPVRQTVSGFNNTPDRSLARR